MKRHIKIFLLVALLLPMALPSCKEKLKIKSLTELLRDEKKNISRFIKENNIRVQEVDDRHDSFTPGIFYKFSNGVYMEVIDRGTEMAVPEKTKVIVRFKGYFFLDKKDAAFDNISKGFYQNTEILYVNREERGTIHYVLIPPAPGVSLNDLMCEGLAFPLSKVGNGARIRLIVPFDKGSNMAYRRGMTMYCEEVRYEFIKP